MRIPTRPHYDYGDTLAGADLETTLLGLEGELLKAFENQDAWSAVTPYAKNDILFHSGAYWHGLEPNTNVEPGTDGTVWRKIGGDVPSATTAALGTVKMSVAPVSPASPVAVGDNDPRLPSQAFAEAVQDLIASFFVAGSGIAYNYDDVTNTFTITNSAPLTSENVQDIVGAMVTAGSNVTSNYDDATGTLTIASAGSSTLTTEDVRDIVGAILVAGANVTIAVNDAADTVTVTAAGGSTADGAGYLNKDVSGGSNITLTSTEAAVGNIRFYGTLTANINVYVPDTTHLWNIDCAIANNGFYITFRTVGSGGVGTDTGVALTSGLTTQVNHIQGAFTQQVYTGGTNYDFLSTLANTEVSVTTTATLTLGKMHVCSGTSANYTVTLPTASGNAGKFVGIRMASGLTKLVTVQGASSQNIDGQNTRVMWAQESCILMSDGTGWTKISGKTRPMVSVMRLSNAGTPGAAQSIPNATVPLTKVLVNATDIDNTGLMANTGSNRIDIKRPGSYQCSGSLAMVCNSATPRFICNLFVTNVQDISNETAIYVGSGNVPNSNVTGLKTLTASDYVDMRCYQNSGSSQNLYGDPTATSCLLTVEERPSW